VRHAISYCLTGDYTIEERIAQAEAIIDRYSLGSNCVAGDYAFPKEFLCSEASSLSTAPI